MDGTVLPSNHTYFNPQLDCAKIITNDLVIDSPDPITIIKETNELRKEIMAKPGPISNTCFPQSWILYYQKLCERLNRQPNYAIISALGITSATYLREKYELYDGVSDTLNKIKDKNIIRTLVTLGNYEVQQHKIDSSGLGSLVDNIEICDLKDVETYKKILKKYNTEPSETAMVGDNLRLDIQPAIDCGIMSFYIYRPFDRFDIGEIDKSQPLFNQIFSFNEIIQYL
jgi:FMN phosphatase YigB (HAD superfamily)